MTVYSIQYIKIIYKMRKNEKMCMRTQKLILMLLITLRAIMKYVSITHEQIQ